MKFTQKIVFHINAPAFLENNMRKIILKQFEKIVEMRFNSI